MNNRGNSYNPYRNRKRKRHLRVTGRFYVFLTCLVVLIVGIAAAAHNGVFSRRNDNRNFIPAVKTQAVAQTPVPAPQVVASDTAQTAVVSQDPATVVQEPSADAQGTGGTVTNIEDLTISTEDDVPEEVVAKEDEEIVKDLAINTELPNTWHNFLLLGTDSRNMKKVTRCDTMIIASVNVNDGRVKIVSLMRDMWVPMTVKGQTKYSKLNAASNYGGVKLMIRTVNELFKMNISEYVLVNFEGFQKAIDILGGIDMDISRAEMEQINISLGENAKAQHMDQQYYLAHKDEMTLKTFGPSTHLTGIQALGYARIRHIDNDYKRTERQRAVLNAVLQKVRQDAGIPQYVQLATGLWDYLDTNVDFNSAVKLAFTTVSNGLTKMQDWRLPAAGTFKSERRNGVSALYDIDFETNTARLHEFIYNYD